MKTYLLILVFGLGAFSSVGQSISSAEYFFDTDPGIGNGTSVALDSNTGQLTQSLIIPTAGLSEGFHSFYIRTLNSSGNWSHYDRTIIYITSFSNTSGPITSAEYYFNTDPGTGNGEALTVNSNVGLLAQGFVIPTTGLPEGTHTFFIRVRDENGTWSVSDSETITILAAVIADDDGDGVVNDLDLCPQTPANAVVDVNGCEVFSLPVTNFKVLTTGESCSNGNNGSIKIEAAANLNYTATLTDANGSASNDFSTDTLFENLTAGSYTLCMTVEGQADYESCQDIVITEPEALSVTSKIVSSESKVTLHLKGGKSYTISVNNSVYVTSESEITIPLLATMNNLSVRTDKECQGTYQETFLSNTKTRAYPNPIDTGDLTVYLGYGEWGTVDVSVYAANGLEVFNTPKEILDNQIQINVDALSKGVYLLAVKTDIGTLNYKIIRK